MLNIRFNEKGDLSSLIFDGMEYVAPDRQCPLFTIMMRNLIGGPETATSHDFAAAEVSGNGLIFRKCKRDYPDLEAEVSVRVDGAQSFWKIGFRGVPDDLAVEWISFPDVRLKSEISGKDGRGRFFLTNSEGCLIDDMVSRANFHFGRVEYPRSGVEGFYPGPVAMQFQAYYTPDGGLYFACLDPGHSPKGIDVLGDGNDAILPFFQHFTGGKPGIGYETVLRGFHGDWQDACAIYRDWMESSGCAMPPKLGNNSRAPAWLTESPVILIYPVKGRGFDAGTLEPNQYFPYANMLPHTERLHRRWDSRVMPLLMHWEGTAPWAPPYVWPPFGGEKMLEEYADALHEQDNLIGVYCSGIAWTQRSYINKEYSLEKRFEEEHLAVEMCTGPRGEMWGKCCNHRLAQRLGYDLCPAREFTVKTVEAELGKLARANIDYVQYFDQNQGGAPQFCYSKKHGHPPTPGEWHTDSMRTLLAKSTAVLDACGGRTVLGCENAAAEPYISDLQLNDSRNALGWYTGTPVPAYAFVFHEYVTNFIGNGVGLATLIDLGNAPWFLQFLLAEGFVSGNLLSVVLREGGQFNWSWGWRWDSPGPDQENAEVLIGHLNRWRRGRAKEFLVFGKMVKTPRIETGTLSLSFTYAREPVEIPEILACAWESNGKRALILANFRNVPAKAKLSVSGTLYDSTDAEGQRFAGGTLDVPPLDAVLLLAAISE